MEKLLNKPNFKEGQLVEFNINEVRGFGTIRGKACENIIDIWIIEVIDSNISKETYPYSCICVPHVCLNYKMLESK